MKQEKEGGIEQKDDGHLPREWRWRKSKQGKPKTQPVYYPL